MVVEAGQSEERSAGGSDPLDALGALAAAGRAAAGAGSLDEALALVAAGVRAATGADAVLVRVLAPGGAELEARVVDAAPATAAQLEGSRLPLDELPPEPVRTLADAPAALRRAAGLTAAQGVLLVPVSLGDRPLASLELVRARAVGRRESGAALVAAGQVSLALRTFGAGEVERAARPTPLELAGEGLAAAALGPRAARAVARLAAEAGGAGAALLWEAPEGDGEPVLAGSHGLPDPPPDLRVAREAAARMLAEPGPAVTFRDERLPEETPFVAVLPLGEPPLGVLELLFAEGGAPRGPGLAELAAFGSRAAQALRAGRRARDLAEELERTRALLAALGQTTAELSLAHTLDTAVEHLAGLLGPARVGVYLLEGGRLVEAAGLGLGGPHVRVAERLLELALGRLRGRGVIVLDRADPLLADVEAAALEAKIPAAVAVPLVASDETIGLLGVYPPGRRVLGEDDRSLLAALAGQLAVAVQNARLHERATRLAEQREKALDEAGAAARRLNAQYEISRSFAQSLSLEQTLEALARSVVGVIDVDAAVIRMPDARREQLVPVASHVSDPALAEPVRAILLRPQRFGAHPAQQVFRRRQSLVLDQRLAEELGAPLLAPFLAKGWTAAVVPVATPAGEVLAALMLLSFRPGAPIAAATIGAAEAIAGQAALAIDNARLYQQQKEFADTMQRSLLPRSRPDVAGLDVGHVYESSSRVDVGGDVYDFLELPDGRLAVVLGDVTGHGVEATADMAMAKFVFRSLVREHPEPGELLAAANDVVVSEIAPGKFITMVAVVVDAARGELACAGGGHPPPRLLEPDGSVRGLDATGLVLGVDPDQAYEEVRERLDPGAAVVLYTDGVVEARRDGELYGTERLDALLARRPGLPAQELARAIVADCRAFAGGELVDDVAVVVIARL